MPEIAMGSILRLRTTIHSVRGDQIGLTESFSELTDKFSDCPLCRSMVFWSGNEFHSRRPKQQTNRNIVRYLLNDCDRSFDSDDHRTTGDNDAIRGQNECERRERYVRNTHYAPKKGKNRRSVRNDQGKNEKCVEGGRRRSESKKWPEPLL